MAASTQPDVMDKLVSLCKRRGFIFQSSEIYGGTGSVWDYGPLGVLLKEQELNLAKVCLVPILGLGHRLPLSSSRGARHGSRPWAEWSLTFFTQKMNGGSFREGVGR